MKEGRAFFDSVARGVFAGLVAMVLGTLVFSVVAGTSLDLKSTQFDPENPENTLASVGHAAFLVMWVIPNVFAGFVAVRRRGDGSLAPAHVTAAILILLNLTANLVRGGAPAMGLLLLPVFLFAAALAGGLLGRRSTKNPDFPPHSP